MSANKANINELYREFYHYNQPVIIAFNIEYIMLVAKKSITFADEITTKARYEPVYLRILLLLLLLL